VRRESSLKAEGCWLAETKLARRASEVWRRRESNRYMMLILKYFACFVSLQTRQIRSNTLE